MVAIFVFFKLKKIVLKSAFLGFFTFWSFSICVGISITRSFHILKFGFRFIHWCFEAIVVLGTKNMCPSWKITWKWYPWSSKVLCNSTGLSTVVMLQIKRKKESYCCMQSCPLHWGVLKSTVVMLQCTIVLCIIWADRQLEWANWPMKGNGFWRIVVQSFAFCFHFCFHNLFLALRNNATKIWAKGRSRVDRLKP